MHREELFVDTPDGGALAGTRCHACGRVSFPARAHCPHCLEEGRVERTALSRRGRLFAFTTAEVGVPSIEAPYRFGFVDLPEGVRVFALLEARTPAGEHAAEPAADLTEGAEMEIVVPPDGQLYRFVPAGT